jgi:hypothetical protein
MSLSSLGGGTSTRGFIPASVDGEEANLGHVSSNLVKLEAVPKMEKALEDGSVQPLAHLASSTVRTFELVYEGRRTEMLLSAETVEDMKKYAGLLSLVYGGLKLEQDDPAPRFLQQLPVIVGLSRPDTISSSLLPP